MTQTEMLKVLEKVLAYLKQDEDCDDIAEVTEMVEDAITLCTQS